MEEKGCGEISYFSQKFINWKLPRFSGLAQKRGMLISSPKFAYFKENLNIISPPSDWGGYPADKFVRLSLTSSADDDQLEYIRVIVANEKGAVLGICMCTWNSRNKSYDTVLINENDLQRRWKGEIKNGFLQLFCELIPKMATEVTDVAIQTEADTGEDKLKQDFRDLFISEKDSDLIIKVNNRKFNVHKGILRVRSSVFDSMLSHDLSEKTEGLINVEDCEPEVFEEFLLFVYSGKAENITSDNVWGLYYTADKYDILDLKKKCVNYLEISLSVENICEAICLAVKHNEDELLKLSIEYFAKNMDQILITSKWLQFVKDNPVEANELYIKSLKLSFTKNNK